METEHKNTETITEHSAYIVKSIYRWDYNAEDTFLLLDTTKLYFINFLIKSKEIDLRQAIEFLERTNKQVIELLIQKIEQTNGN